MRNSKNNGRTKDTYLFVIAHVSVREPLNLDLDFCFAGSKKGDFTSLTSRSRTLPLIDSFSYWFIDQLHNIVPLLEAESMYSNTHHLNLNPY